MIDTGILSFFVKSLRIALCEFLDEENSKKSTSITGLKPIVSVIYFGIGKYVEGFQFLGKGLGVFITSGFSLSVDK